MEPSPSVVKDAEGVEPILPSVVPRSYHTEKGSWMVDCPMVRARCARCGVLEKLHTIPRFRIYICERCGPLVELASDQGRSKTGGDGS